MKDHLSIVVKPTLSCNSKCRHCYSFDKGQGKVDKKVIDRLFESISQEYESAWFIWHGGEPLLMGIRFFKDVLESQRRYFGRDNGRVKNTIQTNGILLDRAFIGFCKRNNIVIGISSEGPCNECLRFREDPVSGIIGRLNGAAFSVGSTISSDSVSRQVEIYDYCSRSNVALSLSPVVNCNDSCHGLVPDPEEYVRCSNELFDRWLHDKDVEVPLMPHYLYILNALGEPVESDCSHSSCAMKWICMEPNGDLYPCGKGCPNEMILGNVMDMGSISDVFETEPFERFLVGTIRRREKCAEGCRLYPYCAGGCSMDAHFEGGIENNGGASCIVFKGVFSHILDTIGYIMESKPDLSEYNRFVRDAMISRISNPRPDFRFE